MSTLGKRKRVGGEGVLITDDLDKLIEMSKENSRQLRELNERIGILEQVHENNRNKVEEIKREHKPN
jgi:hypothetical protein